MQQNNHFLQKYILQKTFIGNKIAFHIYIFIQTKPYQNCILHVQNLFGQAFYKNLLFAKKLLLNPFFATKLIIKTYYKMHRTKSETDTLSMYFPFIFHDWTRTYGAGLTDPDSRTRTYGPGLTNLRQKSTLVNQF